MLLSIYILFVIFAFVTMILSLIRTKFAMFELWGLLSMVIFFILGVTSFNIEIPYCVHSESYISEYTCITSAQVETCYNNGTLIEEEENHFHCINDIHSYPEMGMLFNGLGVLMFGLTVVLLFFRITLKPEEEQ